MALGTPLPGSPAFATGGGLAKAAAKTKAQAAAPSGGKAPSFMQQVGAVAAGLPGAITGMVRNVGEDIGSAVTLRPLWDTGPHSESLGGMFPFVTGFAKG